MATYSAQCSAVGSFGYASNFKLYVVLTNRDGNPVTNKSYVDYNAYCQSSGSGSISAQHFKYFSLNGKEIINKTESVNASSPNAYIPIASGTIEVAHENDGTKKIPFSAQIRASSYGVSSSISGTFELTTIPRASSISCSTANIGSYPTVAITSANSSFRHHVTATLGTETVVVLTDTPGGTYTTWKIPDSFYKQIPNAKSAKATMKCETYSGTTLIGTKSIEFEITTSESACRPTVSATIKDTNQTTKNLTGNENKLVKYKSTAQLVITSTVKNSATIKSVTVNGTNVGTSGTITLNYSNVSTTSFKIVVTDSRGYTNTSYVVTPSYVNYVPLTINANFFRPQPTTGEVQLTYSGNYFNASFGSVANALSITWKYRVQGASAWTTGGTITPTLSGNTISSKTISLGTNFDYQTAYEFQLIAVDKLTTVTRTAQVSVGMPVFYWGKDFFKTSVSVDIKSDGTKTAYKQGGVPILRFSGTDTILSAKEGARVYIRPNGDTNGTEQFIFNGDGTVTAGAGSRRIYSAKGLYANSSGTSGTISNLSESVANFDYIDIFYCDNNGKQHQSIRISAPNGKNITISNDEPSESESQINVRTSSYNISGTSITRSHSAFASLVNGNTVNANQTAYNKIVKVVGYR